MNKYAQATMTALMTYREYILQSRLKQVFQLLLRDKFEEGWLQWITTNIVEEFHQPICGQSVCTDGVNMVVVERGNITLNDDLGGA